MAFIPIQRRLLHTIYYFIRPLFAILGEMDKTTKITEKYESNGWPSIQRPDVKPPKGWNLSLITSVERIRNHRLSPDGNTISYIKDSETLSDVFTLPAEGGWPRRMSTDRGLAAYWDDEVPQWSPDSRRLAL